MAQNNQRQQAQNLNQRVRRIMGGAVDEKGVPMVVGGQYEDPDDARQAVSTVGISNLAYGGGAPGVFQYRDVTLPSGNTLKNMVRDVMVATGYDPAKASNSDMLRQVYEAQYTAEQTRQNRYNANQTIQSLAPFISGRGVPQGDLPTRKGFNLQMPHLFNQHTFAPTNTKLAIQNSGMMSKMMQRQMIQNKGAGRMDAKAIARSAKMISAAVAYEKKDNIYAGVPSSETYNIMRMQQRKNRLNSVYAFV